MQTQTGPTPERDILRSLILPGLRNFVLGAAVLGALLALLAGTLRYWQGWVFAVLFAGLTTAQGIYLGIKDPALLERRKQVATDGQSRGQRLFVVFGLLANLGLMVFSALDHRFGWSHMPALVPLLGYALMVLSFYVYYLVFEENSYAASSIQTFEGQKVISSGLYARVRHPKYVGDLLLVLGMPLALGSWWALIFVVLLMPALVWRIRDEEKLLTKDLPGYAEYTHKVHYRLVPYVW